MPNPAPGRTRYTPTDSDGFERSHSLHKGGVTVALSLKAQTSTLGARAISFFFDDEALTPMELTVGYSSRRKRRLHLSCWTNPPSFRLGLASAAH